MPPLCRPYENRWRSVSHLYVLMRTFAVEQREYFASRLALLSRGGAYQMVKVVNANLALAGERIVEPMLALARCSKQQRIIVAGGKSIELMFELERRGYHHAAATANCGRPAGQYDAALVDWRRRTFRALETTLDWLIDFLRPEGVLVVWTDPQKPAARESLHTALEERGFVVDGGTIHPDGDAVSARRREAKPLPKAA